MVHDCKDEEKAALLLTSVAGKTYKPTQLQDQVAPKSMSKLSYQEVQETLLQLFKEKSSSIMESFSFHRLFQSTGQPIKDYITD